MRAGAFNQDEFVSFVLKGSLLEIGSQFFLKPAWTRVLTRTQWAVFDCFRADAGSVIERIDLTMETVFRLVCRNCLLANG